MTPAPWITEGQCIQLKVCDIILCLHTIVVKVIFQPADTGEKLQFRFVLNAGVQHMLLALPQQHRENQFPFVSWWTVGCAGTEAARMCEGS